MIIDILKNAERYYSVHPLFKQAFEYMMQADMNATAPGMYAVQGDDIRAIFSNNKGVPAATSCAEFEAHNTHIDIQYCINGSEIFGWKPRATCLLPNDDYDDLKDLQLYNDNPDMFFTLTNGQFVILFPEDVHAPMIGEDSIKKLVIKVKR